MMKVQPDKKTLCAAAGASVGLVAAIVLLGIFDQFIPRDIKIHLWVMGSLFSATIGILAGLEYFDSGKRKVSHDHVSDTIKSLLG